MKSETPVSLLDALIASFPDQPRELLVNPMLFAIWRLRTERKLYRAENVVNAHHASHVKFLRDQEF